MLAEIEGNPIKIEKEELDKLKNIIDADSLKSCLLAVQKNGDVTLCAQKVKDKFRLDEDFFRMDAKHFTTGGELVYVNLKINNITNVACGSAHALLLTKAGQLYSMGVGTHGRLGHGNTIGFNEPKLITALAKFKVQKIACGSAHNAVMAINTEEESKEGKPINRQLFTWGLGADNRLGHGNAENKLVPTKVDFFEGIDIEDTSCGFMHTAVIGSGKLYTFGYNEFGQLGSGDKKSKNLPYCVNSKALGTDVKQVFCGGYHTICVCIDNSVYSWGDNESGQLGHGTESALIEIPTPMKLDPHMMMTISKAEFFCGDQNTFAMLEISKEQSISMKNDMLVNEQSMISERKNSSPPEQNQSAIDGKNSRNTLMTYMSPRHSAGSLLIPSPLNKSVLGRGKGGDSALLDRAVNMSTNQASQEEMDSLMKFIAISNPSAAPISMTAELKNMSFRPANLPKKTAEEEARDRELVEENRREYAKAQKRKEQESMEKKRKEEEREKRLSQLQTIWEKDILPHWNEVRYEGRVLNLWREGLPSAVRGKVWMLAIGNKSCITPELFKICTQKAKKIRELLQKVSALERKINSSEPAPATKEDIEQLQKYKTELTEHEQPENKERSIYGIQYDLPRTFPELGFFKQGGGFYEDLEQVLEAFVVCRPDIGYVQGMSYIAGMLLLVMDKFKAFVCMCSLVSNWMLLPFFRGDDTQIQRRIQIFKQIFHYNLPDLCEQFESEGVMPQAYLIEWIMTIFVKSLDLPIASRLWDLIMLDGDIMILKIAVALLKLIEKDVLNCSMDTILLTLKGMMQGIKDENNLVKLIYSIKLPEWVTTELPRLMQEFIPK